MTTLVRSFKLILAMQFLAGTAYAQQAVQVINPVRSVISSTTGTTAMVEARKQTPTGNALNVQIGPGDIISNIPVILEFSHHQLHESEEVRVEWYLASGVTTTTFLISVPTYTNTIYGPHLLMEVEIYEGNAEVSLWESPTSTTAGAELTSYNANRNSASSARTKIYSVASATDGTRLPTTMLISGGVRQGGQHRSEVEFVLKSNTYYRVYFEEITAITRAVIRWIWYEDLGV